MSRRVLGIGKIPWRVLGRDMLQVFATVVVVTASIVFVLVVGYLIGGVIGVPVAATAYLIGLFTWFVLALYSD